MPDSGLRHQASQRLRDLVHSRGTSPRPEATIISAHKTIEEENQPKYDARQFYPARLDEVLDGRYKLIAKLGFGMTATVWLAKILSPLPILGDRKYVVIKININKLSEDYFKGRRVLSAKLATANPRHPGYSHIRFSLDTFKIKSKHGEHLCIIYDPLREPVHESMKKFPGALFNCERLRLLLPPLLKGLWYMHEECRIVHTDLKADNIMMGLGGTAVLDRFAQEQIDKPAPRKMPDHHGRIIYQSCSDFGDAPTDCVIATAKIIDIGLAQWGDEYHNTPIQSNAFTAPEVILQAGWSYPADIWNLGVMLWDLFENFGLFDSINTDPGRYRSDQHLGLMIGLLGPPPKALLKRGETSATYFDSEGNFRKPNLIKHDLTFECAVQRMRGRDKELFIDFIKKMIAWLPEERWTAKQLLEHPWLHEYSNPIPIPVPDCGSSAEASSKEHHSKPVSSSTSMASISEVDEGFNDLSLDGDLPPLPRAKSAGNIREEMLKKLSGSHSDRDPHPGMLNRADTGLSMSSRSRADTGSSRGGYGLDRKDSGLEGMDGPSKTPALSRVTTASSMAGGKPALNRTNTNDVSQSIIDGILKRR